MSFDEAEVGELLHQRGWRKVFSVTEMAGAWDQLVTTVEHGYEDTVEEYSNDLYCRNWLHLAWPLLNEHTVLIWTARIKELDGRFVAAPVDDDGHALGQFHRIPDPAMWWWRRHPRVLAGDLGRSLRGAGATGINHP
ncbi:hypothetical protein OG474_33670 [Kribbella sp. NBC_01505]|uniref:hypothetical protein n=1 Tax=Kribbella sp. NBC_01505 TaxID=2903580 RepID=UPI003868FF24